VKKEFVISPFKEQMKQMNTFKRV